MEPLEGGEAAVPARQLRPSQNAACQPGSPHLAATTRPVADYMPPCWLFMPI